MKALGQEHSDARLCARNSAPNVSRHPPDVSVAEAHAKMARLEGSLAVLGPDDAEERRVLEEALSKVRARATVALVGQRLDECEKYCERAAKRLEKAQEVVTEALKVLDSGRRSWRRGSAAWWHFVPKLLPSPHQTPHDARERRVGPIAETSRADGRRVEVESPSSFGEEHGGEQFEMSSGTVHVGGGIREEVRSSGGQEFEKVETDFGQSDFGHRYPTDFGQSDFGFGQTDFGQTDFGQR